MLALTLTTLGMSLGPINSGNFESSLKVCVTDPMSKTAASPPPIDGSQNPWQIPQSEVGSRECR